MRQLSQTPAAIRKRRERERPPGFKPYMVDAGEDVFNTMQYLGWIGRDHQDQDEIRELLGRALSDWAKLRNPFLV